MSIKQFHYQSGFTLLGLTLIVGGFVAFGLWPIWNQEKKLQLSIQEKRRTQEQMLTETHKLAELTQRAEYLTLEVRDFGKLVPEKNGLGSFLEELSHELTTTGVNNTSVQTLGATRLGRCLQSPIQVHGTGTFQAVHDFLIHMEELNRKSSVSRLTIESDPTMSGVVNLDMTLSIYNALPLETKATSENP